MTKPKLITEVSVEDLLKLVEGNTKKIHTFEYTNDVLDFLSIHGITNGEHKVFLALIHDVYKKWSKAPLLRNPFAKEMAKLFKRGKRSSSLYFLNKPVEFFLERSVVKKRSKTKTKSWLKHFQRFMGYYNLNSGSFYIKDIVLYNLYDKWVYKNGSKNQLNKTQFLKFCRLMFNNPKVKCIKQHEWFGITENVKEYLTPELINLMQQK